MWAISKNYLEAELEAADRAMLDYVVRLTLRPGEMRQQDVIDLREAGFSDIAIHDIAQVAALFAYYNRLADGLGIDPEPEHEPW